VNPTRLHPRHGSAALTVRLALAVALPALLTGCGGGDDAEEPTSYVVTDLEGGTAAPDSYVAPPSPSATRTPRDRPSDRPSPEPTDRPSDTPSPPTGAPDGDRLLALAAAAAGRFETVRVDVAGPTLPGGVTAAFVYGSTDALDATLTTPGQPGAVFRRVQGRFFAGPAGDLAVIDPDDERLASVLGGVGPALLRWDPLLDLRAVLEAAEQVVETDPVAGTTSYAFSLDPSGLPRPSLLVPDGAVAEAAGRISLDADDLPVRLEIAVTQDGAADVDDVVVVDYSGWGERVQIEVPAP
jgi:hypothetical protein